MQDLVINNYLINHLLFFLKIERLYYNPKRIIKKVTLKAEKKNTMTIKSVCLYNDSTSAFASKPDTLKNTWAYHWKFI